MVELGATVATVATVKMLPPKQPSLSSQPSRKGTEANEKCATPYDLFVALVEYHLGYDDEYDDEIRQGLEQKLDALMRHELYAKHKTAPSAEERERPGRSIWTGTAYFRIFAGNRCLLSY